MKLNKGSRLLNSWDEGRCKMKLLRKILHGEGGQALPMALILLLFGGFLVVPTLHLITTTLNANRMVDENTLELYAADAGVEKVLWHIRYDGDFTVPASGNETVLQQFTINGKTVDAKISRESGQPY